MVDSTSAFPQPLETLNIAEAEVDDKQPERDDLAATFTEADLKQYAKVQTGEVLSL